MAIYHASTTTVSRGAGHSSCAKSAYIGGDQITNEITGEIHSYKNRHGVEHNEIILPSGIDAKITPQELWNKAEKAEVRKDARVGREWNISLPHELTPDQRKDLAKDIAQDIADRYQVATQIAIHAPSKTGDERNHHVHILTTTRKIDKSLNLTDKADIERSNKKCITVGIKTTDEQIKDVREMIGSKINLHLEKAQVLEQVSHLSYKDQGIDKIPTKHLGKSATHLERKGIKTQIGDYNRSAIRFNELKTALQAIYTTQNIETYQPIPQNATERAKMYLAKRNEERTKTPEANQEQKPDQNNQKQLLEQILAKKSYDQIIDWHKKEKELKLEQQQKQELDYKLTINKGRGFNR